jgi:ribosome-binding factor A
MDSKRQQQFARLIREELSAIFQRDAQSWFSQVLITVTTVRATPDLGIARVYLSFMLLNNQTTQAQILEDIQEKSRAIRNILGQRIRKSVRVIPELHFFLDDTAEYASHIDKLLSGLDIPPAEHTE